jgi:hypothetical protein
MKVVELPTNSVGDISGGLRRLADAIDAGTYEDAHNVIWIVDCGNARIEFGMLGQSAEPGACALLLMEMARFKLLKETYGQ